MTKKLIISTYLAFGGAHLLGLLSLFFYGIKLGSFYSVYLLILWIINIRSFKMKGLFAAFFFYQLISLSFYSFNDDFCNLAANNLSIYLQVFSYILIPQFFFFTLGEKIATTDLAFQRKIYNFIFALNMFCIIVGICFFLFPIDFYKRYLEASPTYAYSYRMFSYTASSMIMGMICSFSFVQSFFLRNRYKYILSLLCIVGAILTQQRGSWAAIVVGLFLLFYFSAKKKYDFSISAKKLFIFIVLFVSTLYFFGQKLFSEHIENIFNLILGRFDMLSGAVEERSSQWDSLDIVLSKSPWGVGVGALSHKGFDIGFQYAIPDGNFFRILGDLGVVGFLLFLLLLLSKALFAFRTNPMFFVIIAIFILQAVGTNVFDLFYCSCLFWFVLGSIKPSLQTLQIPHK